MFHGVTHCAAWMWSLFTLLGEHRPIAPVNIFTRRQQLALPGTVFCVAKPLCRGKIPVVAHLVLHLSSPVPVLPYLCPLNTTRRRHSLSRAS